MTDRTTGRAEMTEEFADHRQTSAWAATERTALIASVDLAADNGLHTHAWQLTWALAGFLARSSHRSARCLAEVGDVGLVRMSRGGDLPESVRQSAQYAA
jgi:hypothetical protein